MTEPPLDWNSFWDLVTPAEAAEMLRADYGAGALKAAQQCVEKARADDREKDSKFWLAVCAELTANG